LSSSAPCALSALVVPRRALLAQPAPVLVGARGAGHRHLVAERLRCDFDLAGRL
jgi:hypothetical protein